MQHVECHVVQRDSSAIKFDIAEISFILALFYEMKPLTNKRGEKTPDNELQNMLHTKYKPQPRLRHHMQMSEQILLRYTLHVAR